MNPFAELGHQMKKTIGKITDVLFGFKIKVRIYRKMQNGYQEIEDTGKIVKKGKFGNLKRYFLIKGQKEKIPIPEYKYFYVNERGRKSLLLFSPKPSIYYPVIPEFSNPKMKVVDEDILLWSALESERAIRRFQQKSMLEKFYPVILISVTAIAILLVTYGTTKQMAGVTSQFGALTSALQSSAKALESASSNLANIPVG